MIYCVDWITFEKASEMLNVTIDELNELIDRGEILTRNTGLGLRVLKHTVEDFIKQKQV